MVQYTATEKASEVQSSYSLSLKAGRGAPSDAETEHIKPEFRQILAPLQLGGLLAAGVRAILQENGFRPDTPWQHCGCLTCAQRCQVCAARH